MKFCLLGYGNNNQAKHLTSLSLKFSDEPEITVRKEEKLGCENTKRKEKGNAVCSGLIIPIFLNKGGAGYDAIILFFI